MQTSEVDASAGKRRGSLVVVGTGIRSVAQTTIEARGHMEHAEKLFYLVAEPVTEAWIRKLNPTAEPLQDCYAEGKMRIESYREMVRRVLEAVRDGQRVCLALYGHPGVFVYPSHEAIRQAREEGYSATMLPGVSAEDCLFADLGVDPALHGCQSYEATDFLVHQRTIDPTSDLILWQVGVIGEITYKTEKFFKREGLQLLAGMLLNHYPAEHPAVLYEASQYAVTEPVIEKITLGDLATAEPSGIATLYVPSLPPRPLDREILDQLGLTPA
jgi:precorrin-3B methylase